MLHRHWWILLCSFCFSASSAYGQGITVHGKTCDQNNSSVIGATVVLINVTDSLTYGAISDTAGDFIIQNIPSGRYALKVQGLGYQSYLRTINVLPGTAELGTIKIVETTINLNEYKIVEKILAVVQKGDTTEYNSGAYKVNPDADAANLIRKMPGIEFDGKNVKAQGESVLKVLVDGKPFFGDDPNATLHNLPVDMIAKVQVYNEKSEQEKFTGFSEGQTYKTINVVTKPDKRNGLFGKLYAGDGAGDANDNKYIGGVSMNMFEGDKRITVSGQTNNVNIQDFTPDNVVGQSGGTVSAITSLGINYSDKLAKGLDVSGSYFFNAAQSTLTAYTHRLYLTADSGQVYNDNKNSYGNSGGHRFTMKINYAIDSQNSLVIQPRFSLQNSKNTTNDSGATFLSQSELAQTKNNNTSSLTGYNFTGNFLYGHKFCKNGRTFSLSVDALDFNNGGSNNLLSQNQFPNNQDSFNNQHVVSKSARSTLSGNAVYTEPIAPGGLLQFTYNYTYQPSSSVRDDYSYTDSLKKFSGIPDTSLSNTFSTNNNIQKAGASYMFQRTRYNFSIGCYFEYAAVSGNQQFPEITDVSRNFSNVLPLLSFQYKIDNSRYLNVTYNAATILPGINQLQNVVNNANPLQLSAGNPDLTQSYQHNLIVRYNAANKNALTSFSAMLSANIIQNFITTNNIIAAKDTMIYAVLLPAGSGLATPVNMNGYHSLKGYVGYGIPLKQLRMNFNVNVNAGISDMPGLINNVLNYQHNKNLGCNFSANSNISENVDYTISSNSTLNQNSNTLSSTLNGQYFSQTDNVLFNLIFLHGCLINTQFTYTFSNGFSPGFNQNYFLWNVGIGHKLFRKQQGDVRLFVYDAFRDNNNIVHNVTQAYIEDVRNTVLQRYLLLTFTYKVKNFHH